MDNKQREINHVNAYHAQPVHYPPPPTYYSPTSAGSSTQSATPSSSSPPPVVPATSAPVANKDAEREAQDAETKMPNLQHAFTVSSTPEANNSCSSQACADKIKFYCEANDKLIRELEDARYNGYQLRKAQKPLKEKLDAQTKDYRRIQQEYSVAANQLLYEKEEILKLTTEIGNLKAQLAESALHFKKFEMSGTLVENMFTNHLKYTTENKTKKGPEIGRAHV